MNAVKKLTALVLICLCTALLAIPAGAVTTMHEGLQITVETDKELYGVEESITATITVRNTNREDVTINNLEQLIPEGYVLADDSDAYMREFVLGPGEIITLTVTFDSEGTAPEETTEGSGFSIDSLFTGTILGMPKLLFWVILIIAIVIFMVLT